MKATMRVGFGFGGDNVTVKVKGGWAVAVDGEHHPAPDVVTVKREAAEAWLHEGFVELVEQASPSRAAAAAVPSSSRERWCWSAGWSCPAPDGTPVS